MLVPTLLRVALRRPLTSFTNFSHFLKGPPLHKMAKMNSDAESDERRQQFGNRFLTDPDKVFEHNAWDDVAWDDEQEQEAKSKVEKNSQQKVPIDMKEKYEKEAGRFWDDFYSQHQNKFFKDRHWLFTEFPELAGSNRAANQTATAAKSELASAIKSQQSEDLTPKSTSEQAENPKSDSPSRNPDLVEESFPGSESSFRILEVGCGVGNTIFPVLQTNNDPGLFVYGCDLSETAINIVKDHADYDARRCHGFVGDITDADQSMPFPPNSLDIIVLIFVLSAVHPDKMESTLNRLASYLKPGGLIVFRDYGRYDMAQLRFKDGRCLEENFYVRGDGTRVYFFTQAELREMFTAVGLVEEQNLVDRRLQVNRGRQLKMYRVWVQCKYRKPVTNTS